VCDLKRPVQLVTVFSAPNYCNEHANDGAVLKISDELKVSFQVFRGMRAGRRATLTLLSQITRATLTRDTARPIEQADRGLRRQGSGSSSPRGSAPARRFSGFGNALSRSRRERRLASES
jgi:hypothetical protein